MTPPDYVRLRQICLATTDIKQAEHDLSRLLGLDVCHRSQLENFGLENIMFAVNGTFLEVVAPVTEKTTVHRFLAKNQGRGGYMAIFDCSDVAKHKALAETAGVDPIFERYNEKADLLQLNPKQTGATMVEFDHHYGGDDRLGRYEWAGDYWQDHLSTDVTSDILGIEFCSPKSAMRAKLWATLCNKPLQSGEAGIQDIKLDYGVLTFRQNTKGPQEMLTTINMTVKNRSQVLKTAKELDCPVTDNSFDCCGVTFRLQSAA
ncbi:MAG: VOC family protein [Sneathiella sp.]